MGFQKKKKKSPQIKFDGPRTKLLYGGKLVTCNFKRRNTTPRSKAQQVPIESNMGPTNYLDQWQLNTSLPYNDPTTVTLAPDLPHLISCLISQTNNTGPPCKRSSNKCGDKLGNRFSLDDTGCCLLSPYKQSGEVKCIQ